MADSFVQDQAPDSFQPDAPSGYQSPGGDSLSARASDPQRWRAVLTGGGPAAPKVVGDDLGAAALAMPLEAAPAGLAKLAGYLGRSGIGPAAARVGTNSAIGGATGAANSPEDPLQGAAIGGALGGGLSVVGEALGGAASLGKWGASKLARMSKPQASAYVESPSAVSDMAGMLDDQSRLPELQTQAADAIQASRRGLRSQGLQDAGTLRELLTGKRATVSPTEIRGTSGAVDEALGAQVPMHKDMPMELSVEANTANDWKRAFQQQAQFKPGTIYDPTQTARMGDAAQKASALRQAVEQAGGPEVSELNKAMQERALLSQTLRKGLKSPLSFVSSESPDRVAALARAEEMGAGGLLDFGNKLGAAKTMTAKDTGSGVPTFLAKLAGRLGLRASDAAQNAAPTYPAFGEGAVRSLFDNQKK